MIPLNPADYERIKPPKKGKPYPYKCRICGAPAAWTETFAARDRRQNLVSWRICDRCLQAAKDGRPTSAPTRTISGS